ncbi:xylulokinase [Rhodoferax aquaticus]|uniref:Xylulose kinase n=1 Tax=Rhodoferax aquaticus TaxID=2527691 RepID=A0A515ET44_9BURK|nr:xylulokinase [Rhodoferax aquaticus]QDL55839.1 xylulokinase [Rhodoferax aquaticus]
MYLGIDLGTSGIKLVLLDAQKTLVATSDAALTVQRPHPLWSEQDPHAWWHALEDAVAHLRHTAPQAWAQVRAIGLSGQMHGAVVLDAQDQVLRPAILWNDGRAHAECLALEAQVPESRHITGNLAMPGFTAPKLCWLRTHEPQVFTRTRKVLLPKDWLRLQLVGDYVSDMSDASGTLWLDVAKRCWSVPMLEACGLNLSYMPRLIEGSASSGTLRTPLAAQWGLSPQIIVAGGAGDNAASAIGVGATSEGQGFVSLGTSGVVFQVGTTYAPAPALALHAFAHAIPQRWHQMSVMLSAASAFSWAARLTGCTNEADFAHKAASLTETEQAQAPLFLPYLSGERTPHNNPMATGVLMGMRGEHGAADIAYAVMEGVSFGLRDGLAAMGQPNVTASQQPALALVGGGARSDAWAQLVASALNRTLQRSTNAPIAAALGAARLAQLADGGLEEEVCSPLESGQLFNPSLRHQALLAPRYDRYRQLYPALQSHFHA